MPSLGAKPRPGGDCSAPTEPPRALFLMAAVEELLAAARQLHSELARATAAPQDVIDAALPNLCCCLENIRHARLLVHAQDASGGPDASVARPRSEWTKWRPPHTHEDESQFEENAGAEMQESSDNADDAGLTMAGLVIDELRLDCVAATPVTRPAGAAIRPVECDESQRRQCEGELGVEPDAPCEARLVDTASDGPLAPPDEPPGTTKVRWRFAVHRAELIVSAATVLDTRLVAWLRRCPYAFEILTPASLVIACAFEVVATHVIGGNQAVTYTVHGSGEEHTMYIVGVTSVSAALYLVGRAVLALFVFLAAHDMNRDLSYMALFSFDGIMLGGNLLLHHLVREADIALVLNAARLYPLPVIMLRACRIMSILRFSLLCCCMDALRIRSGRKSRMKLFFTGLFCSATFLRYVLQRFKQDTAWSKFEMCVWVGGCARFHTVSLVTASNAMCYLAKMFWRYAMGHDLALPRASYSCCECAPES
eukprot:NODE_354_length_1642_cov_156.751733.p1 GENE.NODE_354_length_1642_cov_156.751733~~NODE_354_length_1642_cov_156.751733.p1  ORF type:complete len:482 (-),score=62.44 NODE_354_length_1642_cov_156.751733:81-1526(-)